MASLAWLGDGDGDWGLLVTKVSVFRKIKTEIYFIDKNDAFSLSQYLDLSILQTKFPASGVIMYVI